MFMLSISLFLPAETDFLNAIRQRLLSSLLYLLNINTSYLAETRKKETKTGKK
jgi:hypothetical protein